jgi:hypothetical protein
MDRCTRAGTASASARQVGIAWPVLSIVATNLQSDNSTFHVADRNEQPSRARDGGVGVDIILFDVESGHGKEGFSKAVLQFLSDAGAAGHGQARIATTIDLAVRQATLLECLPMQLR